MALSNQTATPAAPEPLDREPRVTKRTIAQRTLDEAKRYVAFAAYLMVVPGTLILFSLNIYARVNQDVQQYPSYRFYALALIYALVLGKFMLVAEMTKLGSLAVGHHLRQGPLIYPILYQPALFSAVLTVAYVLEEVLVGAWHEKPPREVLPEIAGVPRGLATVVWVLFVAPIPYFAYRETDRALCETRLRALLFNARPAA